MDDRIGKSRYSCRYPNCGSKYYKPIYKAHFHNKRFYRFPKSGPVSILWKKICNIEPDAVTHYHFVCEDHFASKDFLNHTKHRLKAGAVPAKPFSPFIVKDHDYTTKSSVKEELDPVCVVQSVNWQHDKYSFLFDNDVVVSVYAGSSCADPRTKKMLMLDIHRSVTSKFLELKNVLSNETYILRKLIKLYKDGKFNSINRQLVYVSNEFLRLNLECSTPATLREWTEKDHFLALRLYNCNEKLYKYLCSFFQLPLVKTLDLLLSKFSLRTGIDILSLSRMKDNFGKMHGGNRACVLLMEEMMLTHGVNYDKSCQHLCGYQDLGHLGRSGAAADRVLVFMARGLRKNWTQIVSYYFVSGPLQDVHLQNVIVTAVKCLQSLDLNVIGFVCQQNSTNLNALALLTVKNESTESYFYVNSIRISIIFDVRHLLTATRNALTKCKVLFDEEMDKVAKLSYIQSAYNLDQSKRIFKQLYKLKNEYFEVSEPNDKVDVKAVAAILSYKVAASIETFVLTGDLPQEAMNTAEFADIMDTLFDSLNGSGKKVVDYKKYRRALSRHSPHLKLWRSMLVQLKKWKLIDLSSEQDVTTHYSFIKGWLVTLESISHIWEHLMSVDYFYQLSLRRFNLEPLENLFKDIARCTTTNESPTSYQFLASLKTVILNGTDESWINDDCYNLTVSGTFIECLFEQDSKWDNVTETYFDDLHFDVISKFDNHEAAAYFSGYLLRKMDIPDCDDCRSHLLAEWATMDDTNDGCGDNSMYFKYACDAAVGIADRILHLLYDFLREHGNNSNLEDNFKMLNKSVLDSFKFCDIHNCNKEFINLCIKLGIYKFCFNINDTIQNK